jgi:hypothetical protein
VKLWLMELCVVVGRWLMALGGEEFVPHEVLQSLFRHVDSEDEGSIDVLVAEPELVLDAAPPPPPPPPVVPELSEEAKALIAAAVLKGFVDVGLPLAEFGPEFDLVRTGKLYAVLHHTCHELGKDHGLRTVADLQAFVEGL